MQEMRTAEPHPWRQLQVTAADGYVLGARRFAAQGRLRGHIVVASATGVPQPFYRRFAEFAASQGYAVTTFDYRGIGQSRPENLRALRMDFRDWGRLDTAAVFEAVPDDGLPVYLVGHSYGGHALGLMPNHQRVSAAVMCGVSAGWHGWMPPLERIKVWTIWNVVLPPLTAAFGYLPGKLLRLGENLPADAYRQWRHWCHFPHYFFDDPKQPQMAAQYAQIRTPILAINATDDLWALPISRDAFVCAYRNAQVQTQDLCPQQYGAAIGHMGYFRSGAMRLWPQMLQWLEQAAAVRRGEGG